MHHAPYHPVRPTQQARSAGVIGKFQAFAHRRAAHAHSIETEGRYLLDSEPVLLTGGPQALDRAAGVAAVAKVIADHQMPRAQPLDNQFIDKGPGGHGAHAFVETQGHQALHALRSQRKKFLPPPCQARRSTVRIDELLRTRLEHQHRGRRAQLGGSRFEHADHLLVTQMDAVVVAHGQNTAPMALRDVM